MKNNTSRHSLNKSIKANDMRLDADAWIGAALSVLADKGIADVRVESLARDLGVTKGSFYWHFKDREALLSAMLQSWRRRATLLVMERIERKGSARERLEALLAFPMASSKATEGANVELSIRLWGRHDKFAKSVLEEVDGLRLRYIARIFSELGFDDRQAVTRAAMTYSFMRVGESLPIELGAKDVIDSVFHIISEK